MLSKNYKVIIIVLSALLLIFAVWAIFSLFFSNSTLVKVPLLDNTFVAKNADKNVSEEVLFNTYLLYMNKNGYKYLPDERMGGIINFEKDGKRISVSYPKFIKLK